MGHTLRNREVGSGERQQRRGWLADQHWKLGPGGWETLKRIRALLLAELKYLVGIDTYLATEDRRVLEKVIFPHFVNDASCRNVLFVGCSWCTRPYRRLFGPPRNYWTIDRSRWKRRYGAKHHIVAPLEDLGRHVEPGTFDLIVCNGVYGWGLNQREDIEAAIMACRESLRKGGVLLVGWDDVEKLNPCALSTWKSLATFEPFVFPPLQTAQFVTDTPYRHTYSFYRRPPSADDLPASLPAGAAACSVGNFEVIQKG